MNATAWKACLILIVISGGLAGCLKARTDPSRFYLLTPIASNESATSSQPRRSSVVIGLGPISLPDYVNRPQLVTRSTTNEIIISDFDRWAEPLPANIQRVLSQNLAALLPAYHVVKHPWYRTAKIRYQVQVDFLRFEPSSDGTVTVIANWKIRDGRSKKTRRTQTLSMSSATNSALTEKRVASLSQALGELSTEIATSLRALK